MMHTLFHQIPEATTEASNPRCISVKCYRTLVSSPLEASAIFFTSALLNHPVSPKPNAFRGLLLCVRVLEGLECDLALMWWAADVCGGVQMGTILVGRSFV